jgi:hypothetical protein
MDLMAVRCSHGRSNGWLGRCGCPNNWCKLQALIRKEYKPLKTLPLPVRLWVWFMATETENTKRWEKGLNTLSQTFITVSYKGKEYFKRFGTLKMRVIFALLLLPYCAFSLPANNQNLCLYWLEHFDMVIWLEEKILQAWKEEDYETVRYFRKLIRKQIAEESRED